MLWKKWLEVFRSARVPEARTAVKYFLEDLAKGEGLRAQVTANMLLVAKASCVSSRGTCAVVLFPALVSLCMVYVSFQLSLDELECSLSKESLASFERMCRLRLQR